MKDLFLIRHAHAGPYLLPDESRKLSIRGLEEAQELKRIFMNNNFPTAFGISLNRIEPLKRLKY